MIDAIAHLLPPLASERRAALWFPFVLPGFNELEAARGRVYGGGRFGRRSGYDDLKKQFQSDVAIHAIQQRRAARGVGFEGRLFIACNWREPDRKRDPDNIVGGGKKILMDGLALGRVGSKGWTGAGIFHCDGQHCIAGFLDVISCDPKWPGVAVHILEIAGPWDVARPVDLR